MPANLTPEFKAAETAFRQARDPGERLQCLREMLRTIPKHKGTDHLQAHIKTRIKELTEELAGPKRGGTRGGPVTVIRPEGAAQVVLLGPPNSGKSALHARLTNSNAQSGPYPFTTRWPQPGMLPFEDIHFQLIDLPPVAREHPVPWLGNALLAAAAALLVVDLGDPDCTEQVMVVHELLREQRVTLTAQWTAALVTRMEEEKDLESLFAVRLPVLMIAAKADRIPALAEELPVFQELTGLRYPVLATSVVTGDGLEAIGPRLFQGLGIVRVYTKAPGRPPQLQRPFTVRRGQTVVDVARLIHRDMAQAVKYARLWGRGREHSLQVGPEHAVADGDVVELHT